MADSRTRAGNIQAELQRLAVSESKEVLGREKEKKEKAHGGTSEAQRTPLKEPPVAKVEEFEQKSKVVKDYSTKGKINIHESR